MGECTIHHSISKPSIQQKLLGNTQYLNFSSLSISQLKVSFNIMEHDLGDASSEGTQLTMYPSSIFRTSGTD